ncbi:MAG: ATP-binding cassette domain-containing protein [Nitrospinota bacterium]|nr:MAG: ATP-binding cassette domain-containing protein [Nitrospinota bacterium]
MPRHPLLIYALSLVVLPHLLSAAGLIHAVATEIAIFAMVGLGFNLLLGYTGLLSFGHGAYFGLAAYAAALFQIHLMPGGFFVPILFAIGFAALLGLITGFLALRRRGVYFSLLTLAFTALIFYVVYRWTSFTGGENGLGGITRPPLLGMAINNQLVFYYLVAFLTFLVAWLMWRVVDSPFGRVLVAIRENEQRATFIGYPVHRYKLLAFVLSATVVGFGGSLFAFLKYFVSADLVHPFFSGEILAMSIIGGMRSFLGPPLGAAFFIVFREVLSEYTDAWLFYFGLLFMAFILFSPTGLMGLGERILAPWRRKQETIAAMAGRIKPQPSQELPPFLRPDIPAASSALLQCQGVVKRFGGFVAVSDVTLQAYAGRLQSVIGPNGAGKTTLFNVFSGMYPPDAGSVHFLGERIDGLSPDRIVARGLARSFQITNLFQDLTVYENLRLGIQAHHPNRFHLLRRADTLPTVHEETEELIRFLGLEGLEQALVSNLSYGGQRLLEIGLTLTAKPKAIMLDEPLAGLAAAERERVTGLMKLLARQMAVLVVEHDIDRVFAFSDAITVMNDGRVLVDGPPAVVRNHREVQEVYLGSGRKSMIQVQKPRKKAEGKPILTLKEVNTFYGKSHILYDVSLELRDNEVVALLGRNGAGKSSTLRSIMGLSRPRQGHIFFEETEITGRTPEAIARLGIRLVPQGRRLFPNLTVAENLALGRLKRGPKEGVHWDEEQIFRYFPRVKERLHFRADILSGGEQQMVAIARALSGNVRLLLLDEPFEGLSPALTEEVFHCINQLRETIPILLVEHDLDLALSLADRVYVLDRGHITYEGPAEPLLTNLDYRKEVLWV